MIWWRQTTEGFSRLFTSQPCASPPRGAAFARVAAPIGSSETSHGDAQAGSARVPWQSCMGADVEGLPGKETKGTGWGSGRNNERV